MVKAVVGGVVRTSEGLEDESTAAVEVEVDIATFSSLALILSLISPEIFKELSISFVNFSTSLSSLSYRVFLGISSSFVRPLPSFVRAHSASNSLR